MTAHSYILQKLLHIAHGGHNYTFVNISYILLHLLHILQSYMCKSGLYTQLGSHIPILLDMDKDMCAMHIVHVSVVSKTNGQMGHNL